MIYIYIYIYIYKLYIRIEPQERYNASIFKISVSQIMKCDYINGRFSKIQSHMLSSNINLSNCMCLTLVYYFDEISSLQNN